MCVVALKSMTYAMKAKKVLLESNIFSEIIKIDPKMTHSGCAYGVKFDCINLYSAKDALTKNHVKYTEIIAI